MEIRQGKLIQNVLSRKSIFGNGVIITEGDVGESELFISNVFMFPMGVMG